MPNDKINTKANGENLAAVPRPVILPVSAFTRYPSKVVSVENKYVVAAEMPKATNIHKKTFGKKFLEVIPVSCCIAGLPPKLKEF